jgi:hypothetical protein
MILDLPKHLAALASSHPAVAHRWKAGDDMAALGNETPALLKNVGMLSLRAVLGLQAALGEWMAERFRHLHDMTQVDQVNAAVWAASIDFRYLRLGAMQFAKATGPIEGPLRESNAGARDICAAYPDAEFGVVRYVVGSANLVKYVLPDSKAFQAWFKAVVQALPALSAPSAREAGALDIDIVSQPPQGVSPAIFGTPVPREAFDPSFDLASADPAALIDAMLVRIGGVANPYLYTAAELSAAGFPGRPYRYPS